MVSILIDFTSAGVPAAPASTDRKPKANIPSKPAVGPSAKIDGHWQCYGGAGLFG